ncbi:MAG TPA: phosphoribosyl-ATP diphosphatase [Acidimicrobiales bacterium]|nr:phosphoribosyl-ATP diphosphatase [Acidimicrobiales bacterium]
MTDSFLPSLETVLRDRLAERPEGSYSLTLLTDSVTARRKVMEEAFEVCLEVGAEPVDVGRATEEAADLVFHLLAALVGAGVPWAGVEAELERRHR